MSVTYIWSDIASRDRAIFAQDEMDYVTKDTPRNDIQVVLGE